MRILVISALFALLPACATTDSDRFLRDMERQEQIERTAAERDACESEQGGAWMCTSPSKRASERYPWLYCSCVNNRTALHH